MYMPAREMLGNALRCLSRRVCEPTILLVVPLLKQVARAGTGSSIQQLVLKPPPRGDVHAVRSDNGALLEAFGLAPCSTDP
mmetsp:Transcript_25430/g.58012  ORF Transcript_25430/g.58012 Transcript_25430/m.58012 type:complete len:81 (-) Transcript_25430:25-267(-)